MSFEYSTTQRSIENTKQKRKKEKYYRNQSNHIYLSFEENGNSYDVSGINPSSGDN